MSSTSGLRIYYTPAYFFSQKGIRILSLFPNLFCSLAISPEGALSEANATLPNAHALLQSFYPASILALGNKKTTRTYHLQSVIFDPRFEEWTDQYGFVMPKAISNLAYGCTMTGVSTEAKPHAKSRMDFLQAFLDIFHQVAPAFGQGVT